MQGRFWVVCRNALLMLYKVQACSGAHMHGACMCVCLHACKLACMQCKAHSRHPPCLFGEALGQACGKVKEDEQSTCVRQERNSGITYRHTLASLPDR